MSISPLSTRRRRPFNRLRNNPDGDLTRPDQAVVRLEIGLRLLRGTGAAPCVRRGSRSIPSDG